jgi:NAD(P)H-flavin reductase
MNGNAYQAISSTIEEVIVESPLIRTLRLRPEQPVAFRTGQFIELTVPGVGEAPFTPSNSHFQSETMDVTIMKAGSLTERLHAATAGDRVGLRGPFGSSYPLDKFQGRDLVILGGGVGLAPLRSLFLTVLAEIDRYNSVTFLAGAKTPADFIYKEAWTEWKRHPKVTLLRAVDAVCEGPPWDEDVCLVTKLLDKLRVEPGPNPVVVCGPPVMMKFGTRDLLRKGFREENIYLSMEKKMYCGVGQCRHCQIGPYFACKDGPVFTYDRIKNEEGIWD